MSIATAERPTFETLRQLMARMEETKKLLIVERLNERQTCLSRIAEIDKELVELGVTEEKPAVVQTTPVVQATPHVQVQTPHSGPVKGTPINPDTGKQWTQTEAAEAICKRYPNGLTKVEIFEKVQSEIGYVFEARNADSALQSFYAGALLPLRKTSPATLIEIGVGDTKKFFHRDHKDQMANNF